MSHHARAVCLLLMLPALLLSPVLAQDSPSVPEPEAKNPANYVEMDHRAAFILIRKNLVGLVNSLDDPTEARRWVRQVRSTFEASLPPVPENDHERVILTLAKFASTGVLQEADEELLLASDEEELLVAEVLAVVNRAAGSETQFEVFARQAFHLGSECVPLLGAYRTGLQEKNDIPGMLTIADRLIELEPGNPQHHYYRGIALLGMKKTEDALESMKSALDLEPTAPAALNGYARCLSILGRYEEAIPYLEQLTLVQPESMTARENLLIALGGIGDVERVEAEVARMKADHDRFEWTADHFRREEFKHHGHEIRVLESFHFDSPYAFKYLFEYRNEAGNPVLRYLLASYAEEGHAPGIAEDGTETPRSFHRIAYTPDGMQHRYESVTGEPPPYAVIRAEAMVLLKEDGIVDLGKPLQSTASPK